MSNKPFALFTLADLLGKYFTLQSHLIAAALGAILSVVVATAVHGRFGVDVGQVLGWSESKMPAKFALISKELVIFEAVYDRPGASNEQLDREVMQPVMRYLKQLQSEGYVVIDTTTDAEGNMKIAALPANTVDLTAQLQEIVQKTH